MMKPSNEMMEKEEKHQRKEKLLWILCFAAVIIFSNGI